MRVAPKHKTEGVADAFAATESAVAGALLSRRLNDRRGAHAGSPPQLAEVMAPGMVRAIIAGPKALCASDRMKVNVRSSAHPTKESNLVVHVRVDPRKLSVLGASF